MKIKEINVKSIITKTNLPAGDYVINPYVGCLHGCKYCYARFMKRFTGHSEPWGEFIDVKLNAPDLIPTDVKKYKGKYITIGSVTDPYQEIERKYELTRKILNKLIPLQPKIDIITKSDLVLRDIDLLKQFDDAIVLISLSMLNEQLRKQLEPNAPSIERRINALKELHKAGIKTSLFISPIFPEITDWKKMINQTKGFVTEYWFENLNLYPSIQDNIYSFLRKNKPELVKKYEEIYSKDSKYWHKIEQEIINYCKKNKIKANIAFHHGKTTKITET